MPLRILHLVSYSLYSGPLPSTLGLALAQQALGHTVYLGFDNKRGAFSPYEEAADDYLQDANLSPPVHLNLSAKSTLFENIADLKQIRHLLREKRIDIIHAHLSHDHVLMALAAYRQRGILRIRTFHAIRSLKKRWGQSWLNSQTDGWIVRCFEHQKAFRQFERDPKRTRVIVGGIQAKHFVKVKLDQRKFMRKRFHIPLDAKVLVHVALMQDRGQIELLSALHQLGPKAPYCLLVGRGLQEDTLKEFVQRHHLQERVKFTGYLKGDDLMAIYAAADCAFIAQPGNDASGRAALEAMAAGRPVLAVKTGALAELVTPERGYVLADRDPSTIQRAIQDWLKSDSDATKRGCNAKTYVQQHHNFEQEALTTLNFYQAVERCKTSS